MITCVCASISLILQLSSQRTLRLSAVVQSQRLLQHYERKWWRGHNSDLLFVALLKCIYCLGINPVFVRAACAAAGLFPALSHLYEGCSERLSRWKVDPLKLKKKKNRHHHSKSQEHLQSLTSQPHRLILAWTQTLDRDLKQNYTFIHFLEQDSSCSLVCDLNMTPTDKHLCYVIPFLLFYNYLHLFSGNYRQTGLRPRLKLQ